MSDGLPSRSPWILPLLAELGLSWAITGSLFVFAVRFEMELNDTVCLMIVQGPLQRLAWYGTAYFFAAILVLGSGAALARAFQVRNRAPVGLAASHIVLAGALLLTSALILFAIMPDACIIWPFHR